VEHVPKPKSHKGLLKRIRITAGGKIKHRRRGKSHLNSEMSGTRSRHLRRKLVAHSTVAKKFERVLQMRLKGREQE
jgi:large subunit ribosomal protein L35